MLLLTDLSLFVFFSVRIGTGGPVDSPPNVMLEKLGDKRLAKCFPTASIVVLRYIIPGRM